MLYLWARSFAFSLAVVTGITLAISACATSGVKATAPDGFAALKDESAEKGVALRAVTASGVVYRVRTLEHDPHAELAFWKEALQRKLEGDGYVIVDAQDVQVAGQAGAMLYAVAPIGADDFGFLVAFTTTSKDVILAEAAGPRAEVESARAAVLGAAQTRIGPP